MVAWRHTRQGWQQMEKIETETKMERERELGDVRWWLHGESLAVLEHCNGYVHSSSMASSSGWCKRREGEGAEHRLERMAQWEGEERKKRREVREGKLGFWKIRSQSYIWGWFKSNYLTWFILAATSFQRTYLRKSPQKAIFTSKFSINECDLTSTTWFIFHIHLLYDQSCILHHGVLWKKIREKRPNLF